MPEPVSDDVARNRWLIIGAMRLGGVAMVVAGALMLNGQLGGSAIGGYVLFAIGLTDTFVVPQLLSRKWRTPGE
jgi:hypothetical protein